MRKVTSYYRPPWICGRHDITSSSAIIYNVIAGVNFFFEEFSATVAGFILNTPKSAPIDIFAISDQTGVDIGVSTTAFKTSCLDLSIGVNF